MLRDIIKETHAICLNECFFSRCSAIFVSSLIRSVFPVELPSPLKFNITPNRRNESRGQHGPYRRERVGLPLIAHAHYEVSKIMYDEARGHDSACRRKIIVPAVSMTHLTSQFYLGLRTAAAITAGLNTSDIFPPVTVISPAA